MQFIRSVALVSAVLGNIGLAIGVPDTAVAHRTREIEVQVSVLVEQFSTTCHNHDNSLNATTNREDIVATDVQVELNFLLQAFIDINAALTGQVDIDVSTQVQIKALATVLVSIYLDIGATLSHCYDIPELAQCHDLITSIGVQARLLLLRLDHLIPGTLGFVQLHLGITEGLLGVVDNLLRELLGFVDHLVGGLLTCIPCASKCLYEGH
ncbi:hypothetical protein NEOLI_001663 [Neolecta irregularis DAH-3]|uniref:Uncharacterized protein n=1 Tax=Neolecta irregularis (strain DAH-3) TaxID=1198029 RepID=A0A1U7LMB3_NEOID|nr:hypothetical protein NEOLI_001663 [Neolecta irregularis DAH-3]|eukprot:OLL23651.1 hypothetical protein NEOLI_001663 [Neolecta irregularis DAH-3]